MSEVIIFLLAVIFSALFLFAMVFYAIMLSDLECDYINPIDLCNRLNQFILPEYIGQYVMAIVFLFSGNWTALIINLPVVAFNTMQLTNSRHMYDATEIFRTLPAHKKETFLKMGFYLLCFFYYLYRMILGLVEED
ncbi:cornichon [Basidiobolus meristosporus CBS 931.73]|uniref:Cornichon n=1 Tax=Basidiobolus meristosporus CBS 931.73 TaxID=1314790 RepID=A0A1Y1XN54_9FUNG|nr:cornichon [Basidiobolus meristosporus CBS 931.73]|eukprot:ORX87178.1 cornichon [Basidiobolus meristosporus CBS 931.73]